MLSEWFFGRGDRGVGPRPARHAPEWAAGQRIDSQGTIESVVVPAGECLLSFAGARISILWGDPV
jgi:hypothetical protein